MRRGARRCSRHAGISTRVVSMPSWDLFEAQPDDYRHRRCSRPACPRSRSRPGRASAGRSGPTTSWRSTASANPRPGDVALANFGYTAENVANSRARPAGRRHDMTSPIARLIEFGQSPWYDNLTRALARGGSARPRRRARHPGRHVEPDDLREGDGDRLRLRRAAPRRSSAAAPRTEDGLLDARRARHRRRRRHPATRHYDEWHGGDGFVSIEVNPDLAHDTEAHARAGAGPVRPARPAERDDQDPGDPRRSARRSRDAIAAGINVNITLIFALERYQEVIEAYLEGLEQRVAHGEDISAIASVASFFVSRVDTETDRRLPEGHPLRGKAAVANAEARVPGRSSSGSAARGGTTSRRPGARLQRPLWASTSTKNPAYSPTLYVDELIGRNTVNTLAQASIDALRRHRRLARRLGARRRRRSPCGDRRSRRGRRRLRRRDRDVRARRRRRVQRVVPRRAEHAREEGARAQA